MYDENDIDGELLIRRRGRYEVPRLPDDGQLTAPVHIAVASWRALTGDPEWPRQLRWVVVVSDVARDRGRPVVHRHRLERGDGKGWPKLVESVRARIAEGSGPAWVAVSTGRIATANVFCAAGLPVTLGLEGNRAADRAVDVMQECRQRETMAAGAAGWSAAEPVEALSPPQSIRCEWLPAVDRPVSGGGAVRLVVATDASADSAGAVVRAAVADDGALALESSRDDCPINEAELGAISLALERFGPVVTDELRILSDSVDAVQVARALAYGRVPAIGFRGISDDALDRFEDAWDGLRCVARFFHVKAHVGHPLNEAADELAGIGRLAARHRREVVEGELDQRATALSAAVARLSASDIAIPHHELQLDDARQLTWSLGDVFGAAG